MNHGNKIYKRGTVPIYGEEDRGMRRIGTVPTYRGFSLVELLVVLAIMGALLAVAVPNFVNTTLPHMRLKTTARGIYMALQHARSKAVGSVSEYGVQFDLDAVPETYQIMTRADSSSPWTPDLSSSIRTVDTGIDIDNINSVSTGTVLIQFNPVGTSSTASIKLKRTDNPSDKYKVVVYAATGRVRIQVGW